MAVQGQVGSTIAFRDVWGGAAWQCPGGGCNTQLPEGVPGHQRLRARTVAIVVHLDCRPSEPWYGVVFCSGALHMPAPWRGERYALVFFTQVGFGKVSWEDLVLLRSLGFRLCAG